MNRAGGKDCYKRRYEPPGDAKDSSFSPSVRMDHNELQSSRHLWVGNINPRVTESLLAEQFLRFGELESIALYPRRGYAFVNFKKDEDASLAYRELQGIPVAGFALKIEFAKGERQSSSFSYGVDFHNNSYERSFSEDRASCPPRNFKRFSSSSERSNFDRSKGDGNGEPSEILWVGFPVQLNVDEMTLRRAFSPFGQIEKITAFPGRSYAFVKFRSIMEACRAKDALQGKLFNNPRVNICFSKSESGPMDCIKRSNDQFLPSSGSVGKPRCNNRVVGSMHQVEDFDRTGEFLMESPRLSSRFERNAGDFGAHDVHKKVSKRMGPGSTYKSVGYENLKFEEDISEFRFAQNMLEGSQGHLSDKNMVQAMTMGRAREEKHYFDKPWDSPGEDILYRNKKKLKVPFHPDKDLPEFSLSNSIHGTYIPNNAFLDNNSDAHSLSLQSTRGLGKGGPWCSDDIAETTSKTLFMKSARWDISSSLQDRSTLDKEWKWEGTIAKSGTPICRARCFPVGKVLDITLPEFLNCTARTGLDMLAKHFSQASGVGVVFFVPESDSDIAFYNEFMYYLEEKQRAAVAKLGEKTTLFLVPPSEFSEKVLKVPGKMSISGVLLMFENVNGPIGASHPLNSTNLLHLPPVHQVQDDGIYDKGHTNTSLHSPDSKLSHWNQRIVGAPSEPVSSVHYSLPYMHTVDGLDNLSYVKRISSSASASTVIPTVKSERPIEFGRDVNPNQSLPTTVQVRKASSGIGDRAPLDHSYPPHPFENSAALEYLVGKQRPTEGSSSQYIPENLTSLPLITVSNPQITVPNPLITIPNPQTKTQASSPMRVTQFAPQQLAELASLFAHKQPSENLPSLSTKGNGIPLEHFENGNSSQNSSFQEHEATSGLLASSFGKVLPSPLHSLRNQPVPLVNNLEVHVQRPEDPEKAPTGKEAVDSDPQKRLQATLQLAAALLQQIQQQANPVDRR